MFVKSLIFLVAVTLLLLSKDPAVASQDCTVPKSETCFASVPGQPPPEVKCCSITVTAGVEPRTCFYDNRGLSSAIESIGALDSVAYSSLVTLFTDAIGPTHPCPTEGIIDAPPLPTVAYPAIAPLLATITSYLIYPTCTCG
ncbi:MAG: hypothetical protein J3R72DRAFT_43311 [Linnemannia gamsii]|nr:MAG: hypothetical protein J3R72DRAFT_43311 [Linnemannia gamsii]